MPRVTYTAKKSSTFKVLASNQKHRNTLKVLRAHLDKKLKYQYRDRRRSKRIIRRSWIAQINRACSIYSLKYSEFMHTLYCNDIILNRKMLANLALNEPETFRALCLLTRIK